MARQDDGEELSAEFEPSPLAPPSPTPALEAPGPVAPAAAVAETPIMQAQPVVPHRRRKKKK